MRERKTWGATSLLTTEGHEIHGRARVDNSLFSGFGCRGTRVSLLHRARKAGRNRESGQRTISYQPDGGGGLQGSIAERARQSCPQRRMSEAACLTWYLEFETWSLEPLGAWVFSHSCGLPPTPEATARQDGATGGLWVVGCGCGQAESLHHSWLVFPLVYEATSAS
jgi:hypothetical protein